MNSIENARELLTRETRDLMGGEMTLFGALVSKFDEPMLRMAVAYLGKRWNEETKRHSHNLEFLHGLYRNGR